MCQNIWYPHYWITLTFISGYTIFKVVAAVLHI